MMLICELSSPFPSAAVNRDSPCTYIVMTLTCEALSLIVCPLLGCLVCVIMPADSHAAV